MSGPLEHDGASRPASSAKAIDNTRKVVKRRRLKEPVKKACQNCRDKHAACDCNRPCVQCTLRGLECVEQKPESTKFIFVDPKQFKIRKRPEKDSCPKHSHNNLGKHSVQHPQVQTHQQLRHSNSRRRTTDFGHDVDLKHPTKLTAEYFPTISQPPVTDEMLSAEHNCCYSNAFSAAASSSVSMLPEEPNEGPFGMISPWGDDEEFPCATDFGTNYGSDVTTSEKRNMASNYDYSSSSSASYLPNNSPAQQNPSMYQYYDSSYEPTYGAVAPQQWVGPQCSDYYQQPLQVLQVASGCNDQFQYGNYPSQCANNGYAATNNTAYTNNNINYNINTNNNNMYTQNYNNNVHSCPVSSPCSAQSATEFQQYYSQQTHQFWNNPYGTQCSQQISFCSSSSSYSSPQYY